jgi:hypothetical protein
MLASQEAKHHNEQDALMHAEKRQDTQFPRIILRKIQRK